MANTPAPTSNNIVIVKQLSTVISGLWNKVKSLIDGLGSGKADKVADATEGNFAGLDSNGNLVDSGHKHSDYKTVQTAVEDPSSSSGNTENFQFIATASQNTNGVITVTKRTIPDATASGQKGVVELQSSIDPSETSNTTAATPKAVRDAINSAISNAYHHAGTKTVSQLVSSLLTAANEGSVYNITDSGKTTADFIEGAGKVIREGDNVGICKVGENSYKFDLLSGFVDTSNFKIKQTAVNVTGGALKGVASFSQDANGETTLTLNDIQDGTTSQKGVVQLATSGSGADRTSLSNETLAATPKYVGEEISSTLGSLDFGPLSVGAAKTIGVIQQTNGELSATAVDIQIAQSQVTNLVDDLASKQDNLAFEGTYNASTNKVATESTVSDAIEALDVSAVSVGASKTLASISETDGKISASAVDIQIAESQVTNLVDDLASKQDNLAFDGTYNASTNKVATESTVSNAIDALDVSDITANLDASKTITALSETDGKISATASSIQINESQVTGLENDLAGKAAVNHTHTTGIAVISQSGTIPTTTLDVTQNYTLTTGGTNTTFGFTAMSDAEVTALLASLDNTDESNNG
jgi:hypothetical protein